jgi:phage/plasmid-associated DNA primase
MSLEMYELYGFKFFPCRPDKAPATKGDWKLESNHVSLEKAEELQRTGQMIGAWIPENVIVIDLDKHEGKISGYKAFNDIVKRYNVNLNIGDTFAVKTGGGGMHLFFTTDNQYRQNTKEESVDLRTHKGYVIAAGSPGYKVEWDAEIMPLPPELEAWLDECEIENQKKGVNKDTEKNGNYPATQGSGNAVKKLPAQELRKILDKINVADFRSNDKWIEFIFSAVATFGENEEVYQALTDWSASDPAYKGEERNVAKRIRATNENGGITSGTFIYYMREQNISEGVINKVLKNLAINEVLTVSENSEKDLPFCEPDYYKLAEMPFTAEFFSFPTANTAAASILEKALKGKVIYVASEGKKAFYFDGNKWQELFDIYSVVYTVLYRTIKIYYAELPQGKESNENLMKCVKSFNDRHFKEQTWKEFVHRDGIHYDFVDWDSPEIAETLTCKDGVIDFRGYRKIRRQGNPNEFRLSYIDCKVDDILNSSEPERFVSFLSELFNDQPTLEQAKMMMGLFVSGNASKRLFQIWNGGGRNGKSLLIELLHHVLGEEKAYKHEVDLIIEQKYKNEKYDKINFRGKYFCYSSEVNKNQKLDIEKIKELTGYERINARQIFEKRQTFRPTWQLVFVANDLPDFSADFAIIDRIMILPFEIRFYKTEQERLDFINRDMCHPDNVKPAIEAHKLKPELEKERHSILNFLIDCYIKLQTDYEGLIPVSARSEIKKQKYVDENDEMAIFIKEFCHLDLDNERLFVTTEEIANSYRDFIGKSKLSDRAVIKELQEFEPRITKTSRMVEVELREWSSEYNTYVARKNIKQKRGLKYIGLLTDESTVEAIRAEREKGRGNTPEDLNNKELEKIIF